MGTNKYTKRSMNKILPTDIECLSTDRLQYSIFGIRDHLQRMYVDSVRSIEVYIIINEESSRMVGILSGGDVRNRLRMRLSRVLYLRDSFLTNDMNIELDIEMRSGMIVTYELHPCWYGDIIGKVEGIGANDIEVMSKEQADKIISGVKNYVCSCM